MPGDLTSVLVRLSAGDGGRVVRIPLEKYVAGAVAGEQPVGALSVGPGDLMLQLQSLVSRTFVAANLRRHARDGHDVCADTHCQVYRAAPLSPDRQARVDRAVSATAGRVLTYRGRVIQALYHANCGGHTSAAHDVWPGDRQPYLVPRPDPTCALNPAGAWTWRVSLDDLRDAVNRNAATRVGVHLRGLSVLATDGAARVRLLALEGDLSPVVRGEEFRRVVMTALGARTLRSSRFTLTRVGSGFVFEGRGLGHGAGLCQAGALDRLEAGQTVAEVVGYYYPGVSLTPLR